MEHLRDEFEEQRQGNWLSLIERLYADLLCGADDALTELESGRPVQAGALLRQVLEETEEAYNDGMADYVGKTRTDETFLALLDTGDKSC